MLTVEIDILNILKKWELIEGTLLQPIKEFKLATLRVQEGRSGDKIRLPLWMLEDMIEGGLATVNIEKLVSWIHRIHWREKVQKSSEYSLSKAPPELYVNIELLKYILERARDTGLSKEHKRVIMDKIIEVVNRRRAVISMLSDVDTAGLEDRLTIEERVLLNLYKKIVHSWRRLVEV